MRNFIANHRPTIRTIHTERLTNQATVMAFCYGVGTIFAHSQIGLTVVAFGYIVSSVVNYRHGGE